MGKKKTVTEKFMKESLVIQKQDGYYGTIDGIETLLGRELDQADETIQALLDDGKQLDTSQEPQVNQALPTEEDILDQEHPEQSLNAILDQVQGIETEDDIKKALADQLSRMADLKPTTRRGNFIVYVDGIESDRWTDPKISNKAWVKQIPFVFFWPKRQDNVENGSIISNDGWTVLDKKMARRLKITVHRDDTPELPYFTVKSHVLCIARKDQFQRKKILQRLRGNMALPKLLQQRQEAARNAAAISKSNVQASQNVFNEDMIATKAQVAQSISAASGLNMSVEQAQSILDKADATSLANIENQLNTGQLGEDIQAVISGQVPDNMI